MKSLDLHDLDSSHLKMVRHDGEHMTITFHNGSTYRYQNVPRELFDTFATTESPGQHFHKNIKNHYECSKVDTDVA